MRKYMVIPTYWTRPGGEWKEGDAIYDHPTPLDMEGTLARTVESLNVLNDRDFSLVVIAASTSREIEKEVEDRVREILKSTSSPVPVYFFSHSHLERLRVEVEKNLGGWAISYISLRGYSPIRNMCLLIPYLLGAEVVILIDDDEVFEDPKFMEKAVEFLGERVDGEYVLAKAGYYIQPYGGYILKKEFEPWMVYWDNLQRMNEAFEIFIGQGPRLKKVPFVFGGNAVLRKDVFTKIAFDPKITRGEDIDYLINAKIHGLSFFMDRELNIKHLPPAKPHPLWMRMKEDIVRFLYEREKIREASLAVEYFDPYPGAFLREDLEDKIIGASQILALQYLSQNKREDAQQTLLNINLIHSNSSGKALEEYEKFRAGWERLMGSIGELKGDVAELI